MFLLVRSSCFLEHTHTEGGGGEIKSMHARVCVRVWVGGGVCEGPRACVRVCEEC
jgi:hypothetical protein